MKVVAGHVEGERLVDGEKGEAKGGEARAWHVPISFSLACQGQAQDTTAPATADGLKPK